ncbi:MAG: excinuclease ABC subunit C [Opitutus sp.]|nr:excinuclease ABC subunit C [Opitutus sp.]
MNYVYLLESVARSGTRYVGLTSDLKSRLDDHNSGRSPHTRDARPWRLVVYVAFADVARAREFERYLKVGSGHAFAVRHFWPRSAEK